MPAPNAHYYSPPARPVVVRVPNFSVRPEKVSPKKPVPRTCVLVKGGDPDYESRLAQLPDLAEDAGLDLSEGVDAMSMSGVPPFAEMRDWKPTTPYYNSVTDRTASGSLDGHIGSRHGEDVGSIRNSSATVRSVEGTIRSIDDL